VASSRKGISTGVQGRSRRGSRGAMYISTTAIESFSGGDMAHVRSVHVVGRNSRLESILLRHESGVGAPASVRRSDSGPLPLWKQRPDRRQPRVHCILERILSNLSLFF
jgi:hypothetical protein